jgi:hypothetical protein
MAVRFADLAPSRSRRGSGPEATVGLASAGAAALAIACALSPSQVESGPVLCPFRLATGLPCPGCGLTRAWVLIAHDDLGAALRANPFGYVTMAAACGLIVVVCSAVARGRSIPSLSPVVRSRPFLVLFVGWLLFAAVRIAVVATG